MYTDIVDKPDDRHEEASVALRKIGVMIKAFAIEEPPEGINIPNTADLKEIGGLFIGLSNSLYDNGNNNHDLLLESNLKRENRIRELMKM